MNAANGRARVLVSGHVQGVNFRYYTRWQAARNGVTGWVRNLPDGSVEAVFEGTRDAVERMIDWCRTGPPAARVDDVAVSWEDYRGEYGNFDIRR